jgi:hypothetical protein
MLLSISPSGFAQKGAAPDKTSTTVNRNGNLAAGHISLSPRFSPGDVFRYSMEFQTTTATRKSGLAADPQGPSNLVITWNAQIRIDVLPTDGGAAGGIRLRTTYEKSSANVGSDTFDPDASATQEQYQKLQGKAIEFTLDAAGKVQSVAGLDGIVDGEKASHAARAWIAQLDASAGAPPGGVTVGQKWTSEQSADSLPLAGLVWRTETEYQRDEPCRPANPDLPANASSPESITNANTATGEMCAVLLSSLSLVRPKPVRDSTPEDYRKNGVQTAGTWMGTAQSLTYVSLRTGAVVSIAQTGTEEMDVTLTTTRNTSMRYKGTIQSRSQVALVQ